MGYRVLEHATDIKRVRNEMVSAFRKHGADPVNANVGYKGEKIDISVLWAEDLGIWYGPSIISGSRYWNPFGTKDPRNVWGLHDAELRHVHAHV
jgi:5-methylcytosine-specific restriction enzyme B